MAQSWPRLVLGHADAGVFDGQGGVGLVRDDLHRTNADPTDLQDSRDPHGTPGPTSDASTRRPPNPELTRRWSPSSKSSWPHCCTQGSNHNKRRFDARLRAKTQTEVGF